MSRVYISGPMTGLPEYNYPAFHAAAKEWRAAGWTVLNPAEAADGDTTKPYTWYLRKDIEDILTVDAVAVLPGWQASRGATFEVAMARILELPVLDALTFRGTAA